MKHTGMLLKEGCWVVGENTATRGGQEDQGQPPSWQSLWRKMQVRFFPEMFLVSYFYLKNENRKRHQTQEASKPLHLSMSSHTTPQRPPMLLSLLVGMCITDCKILTRFANTLSLLSEEAI